MNTSSWGLLVRTKVSAAMFTRSRLSRMLPLLSITRPTLTGMSSRLKSESFCSILSSNTRKFSCFKSGTKRPRSSTTVACSTTRLTSRRMRGSCEGGCCASARPPLHRSPAARRTVTVTRPRSASLVGGCVVARFGVHVEGRKRLGGMLQFDADLSPFSIARVIAWFVSHHILVTQLHADFRRRIWQVVQVVHRKRSPARHLGQFAQQRRSVQFLRCAVAIAHGLVDADGVQLNVRLLDVVPDVAFVIPAMIIASIRYDEQGPFGVVCTPHLAQAEVDGIEQCRAPVGGGVHQPVLQFLDTRRERTGQLRPIVERDQEKIVLRVGRLEKLH